MPNQKLEEEIDLHEYIGILIKRKKIILSAFFIFLLFSLSVSLRTPKTYEASVLLMISPYRMQSFFSVQGATPDKQNSGQLLNEKTFFTHKELLKSNIVLEKLIERLKLTDEQGKPLLPEDISGKLDVREKREANIIQLAAQDNSPLKAKELANAWAQVYINYNQELAREEINSISAFILSQLDIAEKNLSRLEQEVRDFNDKYPLDLMRVELDMKKLTLRDYQKEETNYELLLKDNEGSLREPEKENERKRVLSKSSLKSRIAYLDEMIRSTEKDVVQLTKALSYKELELMRISRQLDAYKQSYNNLSVKAEQAKAASSIQSEEVKLLSSAVEPKYPLPVSSGRRYIVAIAGALGSIFGVFLALFIEYWKRPNQG